MKLKLALSIAAIALSSSAFAAGMSNAGGTYIGLGLGWGQIDAVPYTASANNSKGGFSGRFYTGYLFSTGANWMMGPEIGYSFYRSSTSTTTKISGHGVDLLLNASYMLNSRFDLFVKPGIQYATQKYTASTTASDVSNAVRPEINLGAKWQLMSETPLFLGANYQFVWGNTLSTDGTDAADTDASKTINDRSQFTVNVEYAFN